MLRREDSAKPRPPVLSKTPATCQRVMKPKWATRSTGSPGGRVPWQLLDLRHRRGPRGGACEFDFAVADSVRLLLRRGEGGLTAS